MSFDTGKFFLKKEERKRKKNNKINTGRGKNHSALELLRPDRISGWPGVKRQATDTSDSGGEVCLYKMTCYG